MAVDVDRLNLEAGIFEVLANASLAVRLDVHQSHRRQGILEALEDGHLGPFDVGPPDRDLGVGDRVIVSVVETRT